MLIRLSDILESAIALSGADFGNIQLLGSDGCLKIVAERGFSNNWLSYWDSVSEGQGSCGEALCTATRIIVPDVRKSTLFTTTDALDVQLRENVQAVQTTPIFSSRGKGPILGMLSTHYKTPHTFEPSSFCIIDALVRHAADLIDFHREKQQLVTQLSEQNEYIKYLENKVLKLPFKNFKR